MASTQQHFVRVKGPHHSGTKISAAMLCDLLALLVEGCRGAVRVWVEGRSFAHGAVPGWLTRSAGFSVVGLGEGNTLLVAEAPPLAEVAPAQFSQATQLLFVDPTLSCLGVFERSLAEATAGREDTDRYDQALLKTFRGFAKLLGHGLDGVEIGNGAATKSVNVGRPELDSIERLIGKTPPSQYVRVTGRLEQVRPGDVISMLIPKAGGDVKVLIEDTDAGDLASLFGKEVVVAGTAYFRPSGSVLRLEASSIALAAGEVDTWSNAPRPILGASRPARWSAQGPGSGLNAIIGRWPGEETDQELQAALAEVS